MEKANSSSIYIMHPDIVSSAEQVFSDLYERWYILVSVESELKRKGSSLAELVAFRPHKPISGAEKLDKLLAGQIQSDLREEVEKYGLTLEATRQFVAVYKLFLQHESSLDIEVDNLDLSRRLADVLRRAGMKRVSDLLVYFSVRSPRTRRNIENFGIIGERRVAQLLHEKLGITLPGFGFDES